MSAFDPSRRKATDPFGLFSNTVPGTPSLEDLLRRLLPPDPSGSTAPAPPAETPSSELLKGAYGPYEPEVPVYPPIRGFGYRIPIIPAPEEPVPSLSKPPGVPGQPLSRAPDFLDALADVWTSGVLPEMPVRPSAAAATKAAMPQSRELSAPPRDVERTTVPSTDTGIFDLVEDDTSLAGESAARGTKRIFVQEPETGLRRAASDEALSDFAGLADDLSAAPDAAPDELIRELGLAAASLLPGVGEALSAKDAYDATRAALAALDDDRLGDAALQGGAAAIAIFGAIPGIGGAIRLTKSAAKALPALYKLLRHSKENAAIAGRSVSREWFSRWSDNLLSGKTLPQGKMARVDTLSEKTAEFLREKGLPVESRSIKIIDHHMLRMVRDVKKKKGIDVPEDLLRDMPSTFRRYKAVLWDKEKQNLLYIFDIPSDPKKGKFIVEIDVTRSANQGDRKIDARGNFIVSGSRVGSDALNDIKTYETVEGSVGR